LVQASSDVESRAPTRSGARLFRRVDVILRDGRTLRLRPPVRADVPALTDFFRALSRQSLYNRFHGTLSVDERLAERVVDPDFVERGALIGVADDRVVALGNWVRLRDPRSAEAAFAVADDAQGLGIGTRLLERLTALAGESGIERFVAEVLPGNVAMLKVFAGAGLEVEREIADGTVEIAFPIAATSDYVSAVDSRDHVAVVASLRPLLPTARRCSRRRLRAPRDDRRRALSQRARGRVRRSRLSREQEAEPVGGVRSYASIAEIPDEIDLAVLCLPGEHVLAAAEEALRAGIRALCVISAGFAELGAEGRARQEQLLSLVRAHGARLLGPNCLGIASDAAR
jgi:Acyl-CoA synthetase (NDP forming)